MANRKGQLLKLVFVFDILGFISVFIGALLIRFSKDEIISILGGLVMATGVSIISLTRIMK